MAADREPHEVYIKRERTSPRTPRRSRHRDRRKRGVRSSKPIDIAVESSSRDEDQDSDDVLDDYYGGTTQAKRKQESYDPQRYSRIRPSSDYVRRDEAHRPPASTTYDDIGEVVEEHTDEDRPAQRKERLSRPAMRVSSQPYADDTEYLEVPRSKRQLSQGLWRRAAALVDRGDGVSSDLEVSLSLVVSRRGQRYRGEKFDYTEGEWNDADFARNIKRRYHSLKTRQIGLTQKLIAYKTISFVNFLQSRCVDGAEKGCRDRWEIVKTVGVLPCNSPESRSSFMYQLRHPNSKRREWVSRLDELIVPGCVIDLEVKETFDSIKVYWGLLFAVLLSLVVALVYGFLMDNDFATGFSIASWLITAFGFFAAVIAAGEYFGLEKPTSTFEAEPDLEAGGNPKDIYD